MKEKIIIVNILGAEGSGRNSLFESITNECIRKDLGLQNEYVYLNKEEGIDKSRINLVKTNPTLADIISKHYKDNDEYVVRSVFLQTDEPTRAKRLSEKLEDKTILKHIKHDYEYIEIPDIWNTIKADRRIYDSFNADYVINGHRKLKRVMTYLDNYITKIKKDFK